MFDAPLGYWFCKVVAGKSASGLGGLPLRAWSGSGRAAAFDGYKNPVSHSQLSPSLSTCFSSLGSVIRPDAPVGFRLGHRQHGPPLCRIRAPPSLPRDLKPHPSASRPSPCILPPGTFKICLVTPSTPRSTLKSSIATITFSGRTRFGPLHMPDPSVTRLGFAGRAACRLS